VNLLRSVQRFVARIPGIGLTLVVPNTATFLVRAWVRASRVPIHPDLPAAPLSLGMAAHVALDEMVLGIMRSPRNHPHRQDYTRVSGELRDALALYESKGWIEDPSSYHRVPPPLSVAARTSGSTRGVAFEHLAWESGYAPHPGEPGGERWQSHMNNLTSHAYLVRSPVPTDTWLVCVHGFGMGTTLTGFHAFRARKIAEKLGCNLAFPVLPMHGPRKDSRRSGTDFMSYDLMHQVFGLSQATWDVRSLVTWLQREEGAARFGLYGISLGAYAGSLIAGLDDGFDLIIAGIPASDFPRLFRHHSPTRLRRRALEHGMLGEVPAQVHRVVSPLVFEPRVAPERRFIYGALGDRMALPQQAHELWNHWDRPRIKWLNGAHVTSVISSSVDDFVAEALVDTGFLTSVTELAAV
jgi:hypothetical protein